MKKDKKRFLCIFTACLLIVTTCIPAFAQDSKQHIQYYEDGSYTIETLTIDNPTISFYSSTKRGTRSRIYYSSDNVEQWSVTVTGSFSYGNGSSTCTAASATVIFQKRKQRYSNRHSYPIFKGTWGSEKNSFYNIVLQFQWNTILNNHLQHFIHLFLTKNDI